jgi:hypothetical protein
MALFVRCVCAVPKNDVGDLILWQLAKHPHHPHGWTQNGFMRMKDLDPFENRWEILYN